LEYPRAEKLDKRKTDYLQSDIVTWLAGEIFKAFPEDVTGLNFYTLICGCFYYQRIFRDGDLDPQTGIYRNSEDGPCEVCIGSEQDWQDWVIDETVVYKSKFQMEGE
jgi:hypothetical protein